MKTLIHLILTLELHSTVFANRTDIDDDNAIINEKLNVRCSEGDDGVRVRWNEDEINVLSMLKDDKM